MGGHSSRAGWRDYCRLNADSACHARYTCYNGSNVSIYFSIVYLLQRASSGPGCQIHFAAPIQGVAPGQVAAVWQGDWCLGAGIIISTHCEMDSK